MASSGARSSMDVDPQTPSTDTNGVNQNRSPTPPPHRSNGDTPEADSFKLAGNKFFKDGNYSRAIEEFSKGMELHLFSLHLNVLDRFSFFQIWY